MFKAKFPPQKWHDLISDAVLESFEDIKDIVKYNTNIKGAKKELERILYANKVSQMYFNKSSGEYENFKQIYKAIYKGLNNPQVILDSVAFIWVVDSND